jgi:hypothetical protein
VRTLASPGGPVPPDAPWAVLTALFLVDIVSITILFRVPNAAHAAGLALAVNLAAAHSTARLFGRARRVDARVTSALLGAARALLSPPGAGVAELAGPDL